MPEKISEPQLPRGLARLAFRAPIWFYHAGLGGLLGKRFVQITHRGRVSGQLRQTVIEVVHYDEENRIIYVASGFGKRSDWYRNIIHDPHIRAQIGRKSFKAIARFLSAETGGEVLLGYSKRYPLAWRELLRFMGYRVDGSDEDIFALGEHIPVFALEISN